jgi:hypothetical protein
VTCRGCERSSTIGFVERAARRYASAVLNVRRLLTLSCALALLSGAISPAGAASSGSAGNSAGVSKKRGKKRRCRKGYKLKTVKVRRHGKKVKVKRCRKVRGTRGGREGGGAAPLFEPPGSRLEGQSAVPFLQRYLFDSTFTDCQAGWPNCAAEERYSHTSGGLFYYCRLTPTSGSDIINSGRAYQVQNAVVETDGSWTFNEIVDNYGNPSYYEWHVAANGTVTGAYRYNGVEQIGPLLYVSGARDCSY